MSNLLVKIFWPGHSLRGLGKENVVALGENSSKNGERLASFESRPSSSTDLMGAVTVLRTLGYIWAVRKRSTPIRGRFAEGCARDDYLVLDADFSCTSTALEGQFGFEFDICLAQGSWYVC